MSYAGLSWLKLDWCRALLLVALPTACAVGVDPKFDDSGADPDGTAGTSTTAGGTLSTAGTTALPKAGTTSTGGSAVVNPFGGSASAGTSTGGSSSAGSANGGAGGASAGNSSGGSAGAAGKGGSAGAGAGAGGTGGGGCACPVKKTWADNTNMTIAPNDCVDVDGAMYLYMGAKTQDWANKDCNPAMQLAWCPGAEYKFMLCK
mgnify:CR=1 FL=1